MSSFALALALVLVSACAGAPAKPKAPSRSGAVATSSASPESAREAPAAADPDGEAVLELEPMRVEVVEEGGGEVVAYDARSLFDEAGEALVRGRPEAALALYERLLAAFPDSSLVPAALYNAGLAHEGLGEGDRAIERYLAVSEREGAGRDAVDALVRAAAVLADLERWDRARDLLDRLLARDALSPSDRLEAMARRGHVLVEVQDYPAAERQLEGAVAHYERLREGVHFETDYFVAMSRYYLGEIPRRQFQAIRIRLPEAQLQRDVERKAELVLLAGERYRRAVRTGNLYWATAAGYRLGSMQKEFWDAIVLAPIPPHLSPDAAEFYALEIRRLGLRYLERALGVHEKNVRLAEAYRTSTPWSEASRQEALALTALIAREEAGERVVPKRVGERAAEPEAWLSDPDRYLPGRVDL